MPEDRCPEFTTRLTGLAIREYLMHVGEGYANEFYRCFKKIKKKVSYQSVVRYFWILEKLGLIELVRFEIRGSKFPVKYYRIVPGKENDPRWLHPQSALYPITRLGSRRYKKKKE